jgi:hypothetical protein
VVPSLLNTVFNVLIFKHARDSTRRVQPKPNSRISNASNNQQRRISRREISLLKQMILMFCIFIAGWTPVYGILLSGANFNAIAFRCFVIVCEMAMLAITINFFICNHEIKEYFINKIRQCVRR